MAETLGNLSGREKRDALRKAIQEHAGYARQRGTLGLAKATGEPADIAGATMATLEAAYKTLYSFDFAFSSHDDPAYAPHDTRDVESETVGAGQGNKPNTSDKSGEGSDDSAGNDPGEASGQGEDGLDAIDPANGRQSDKPGKPGKAMRDLDKFEKPIVELIKEFAPQFAPKPVAGSNAQSITINLPAQAKTTTLPGLMHYQFPLLLAAVAAGVNVMLVGPVGSGKTYAAESAAKALSVDFEYTGAISSEYKLTGFIDAQGRVVSTAFRRVYTNGGVFLFDEIDGSLPAPVLAFNAALANTHADFSDGKVARHASFRAIAAGNTFGRGADRLFVGRNQLDAATLDRWAVLDWGYDTALEASLIGLKAPANAPKPVALTPVTDEKQIPAIAAAWFAKVQAYRGKAERAKMRLIVSPRATVTGLKLLLAGWNENLVLDAVIWRGMSADDRAKVNAA